MSDTIKALAANMVSRKQSGLAPYVLFIGAGASISSGCSNMLRLVDDVLQTHASAQFEAWQNDIANATSKDPRFGDLLRNEINDKKLGKFFDVWVALDTESKYAILRKHLWDGKTPSEGYIDLAHLIKAEYFTTILSTNLDNLMEKALNKVGLLSPEDFIVIVNGKDSPEEIKDQLENTRVPVKLVKLHGTLESPRSYAFTVEELFNFEKTIKPTLTRIINHSLLVVGHSMQDRDIDVLFEDEGKEINYVNPVRPKLGSRIDNVLKVRGMGSIIEGPEAMFDSFFRNLRSYIETESNEASTVTSATLIEGFLQSIGYESELKAPRSRYKNLHTLYVKPTEYDDILTKLEKDHILFIIGEPHMGKTYTALYLLWEYYQKEYETIHIRHDQLVNLLHRHENNVKELLLEVFTPVSQRPRIVHFDDPFGETWERRTEVFANELGTLLELASGYEHLRVVVTSRLNIFNEAISESEISNQVEELERTLRVHTSYRDDVLLDILHRYMRFYKPMWANEEKIVAQLDEKLPSMLPAPHNIEFFVRTSEKLNSVDAVLTHVEESKKMISALASWMEHMAPYEQVFLMWIEICSTAGILFHDEGASEIDIERAYKENLAYLFSEGHIPGIPTMPFSSAKDKFETILLERRDDRGALKMDFVHPSYHEAFWYAVNRQFPIVQWWELLKKDVVQILSGFEKKVNLVQLKMIERYGTINRDLDQLLLLSAEQGDTKEQLIVLEHMLRRPEQFSMLPQFSRCMHSVISQGDEYVRVEFLDLYDRYFSQSPMAMLSIGPTLLFDRDSRVRVKAQAIVSNRIDDLPEEVQQGEAMRQWEIVSKLFRELIRPESDWLHQIRYSYPETEVQEAFLKLAPSDIRQLTRIKNTEFLIEILNLAKSSSAKLSPEQIEALIGDELIESEDKDIQRELQPFVANQIERFAHLGNRYSFIQDLIELQQAFNLPLKGSVVEQFNSTPVDQWPQLSPSTLRKLAGLSNNLRETVTTRVLEEYDHIPLEYRDSYLEALFLPNAVEPLIVYIDENRYEFNKLADNVLIKLLNVSGIVQYEVLPALLCRFDRLSEKAQQVITNLIDNPDDWWLGGSVGQIAAKKFNGKLSKGMESLPLKIINLQQKQITGALLAEMAQVYLADSIGLQEQYEAILNNLIKDPEIVQYAEDWMDHELTVFNYHDEDYWSNIKTRLRSLSAGEASPTS